MEINIEVSLLFDFYGELLKPSGRQAIDLYYNDDLSLAEIADQTKITRQGVRDSIKRCEQQLFDFEKKLGLYKRFCELEKGLEEISVSFVKKILKNLIYIFHIIYVYSLRRIILNNNKTVKTLIMLCIFYFIMK